jgi:hypothetical protein
LLSHINKDLKNGYYSKMEEIVNHEEWKNITVSPFETLYQISSLGRIRSLHRNPSRILKCSKRVEYMGIQLCNKGKSQTESIHRLVALAFLNKSDQKHIVNHKDGNKLNNVVENLEWISSKENTEHTRKNKLHISKTYKISQYTLDNKLVKVYESIIQSMSITKVSDTKSCQVAKGKRKTAGGFVWKYTDFEYKETTVPIGKILADYPYYIITSHGKVYSKFSKKFINDRPNAGYKYVTLYNGKSKTKKDFSIHYLVAITHIENPDNLPMVNHKNCNREDNRLENLEWMTYSDNMKHKAKQRTETNDNDNKDLLVPL